MKITKKRSGKVVSSQKVEGKTNYGGAYGVDPYQYFTKDDIIEFGDGVAFKLSNIYDMQFRMVDVYIVDYSRIVVELANDDDTLEVTGQADIDMRKVRKPADIHKFADAVIKDIQDDHEIEDFIESVESCSNVTASDDLEYEGPDWPDPNDSAPYEFVATKSVQDSDGFYTDYTMYYDPETDTYFMMFGDIDLTEPDPGYADWECETLDQAWEWFSNYNGFADEEDDIELSEDINASFDYDAKDAAIEELAMDGEVSLGKCSKSTLYRWAREINDRLESGKYDWRVKPNISDNSLKVVNLEDIKSNIKHQVKGSVKLLPPFKMIGRYKDDYEAEVGGFDEADCMNKLIRLAEKHGDLTWYSGLSDEDYEAGEYIGKENFVYSSQYPYRQNDLNDKLDTLYDRACNTFGEDLVNKIVVECGGPTPEESPDSWWSDSLDTEKFYHRLTELFLNKMLNYEDFEDASDIDTFAYNCVAEEYDLPTTDDLDSPEYVYDPQKVWEKFRNKITNISSSTGVYYPNGMEVTDIDLDTYLDYSFGTDRDMDNSKYSTEEKQRSVDYWFKKHDTIQGSASTYRQGDERTFGADDDEFYLLEDLAYALKKKSPNKHDYFVEDCYLDFGSGWMWTTVVDGSTPGSNVQVLNPRQWLNLINQVQTPEEIADEILNGEYCQDKKNEEDVIQSATNAENGADSRFEDKLEIRVFSLALERFITLTRANTNSDFWYTKSGRRIYSGDITTHRSHGHISFTVDKWNQKIEEATELAYGDEAEDFEEYEDDVKEIDQEFTSENTSINSTKLPAVFKMVSFAPGTINIDYGGGRFDNVADYLTQYDVINLVYDPYNRTPEHNKEVIKTLRKAGGADTATCSNVLNVIKEPEVRKNVLENIKKLVKSGGAVYITVYEGNGSGEGSPTKSGYQTNRKTADYLDEIKEVFPNATRKGKLIVAKNNGSVESAQKVEADYLDPPEYPEPDEVDPWDETIELDVDAYITVDNAGSWVYCDSEGNENEPDGYSFCRSNEKNGDWHSEEYSNILIGDPADICEDFDSLIEANIPAEPGFYHITCKADLVYEISGVERVITDQWFDEDHGYDYDEEIYTDNAETDFSLEKSKVRDFNFDKIG